MMSEEVALKMVACELISRYYDVPSEMRVREEDA